jgi:hypothetical protein
MKDNALISAYRKPELFISLPSGGKYYNNKPKLSVDNELAVYSMTARDSLLTKTPDALFNGETNIALIKSCCPDIDEPSEVPVNDLLAILLGIRVASYGKKLDIDIKCPECDFLNMLTADCSSFLGSIKPTTDDSNVTLNNGFIVKLKPYSLRDRTTLQIQQIKQQKLIQHIVEDAEKEDELDELEINEKLGQTFIEIADLTVKLITNCIHSVIIPDTDEPITDADTVEEWLSSISSKDYDQIKEHIDNLSEDHMDTSLNATCTECNHKWSTEVDLDISNFFEG